MMLLLGCLGVLQAIFLPGAILVLALFRIRSRWLLAGAIFALSLMVNYALVWVLVLCSLYTQKVMFAVFFAEAALLAGMVRKKAHLWPAPAQPQPGYAEQCGPAVACEREKYKFIIYIILFYSIFLMLHQCGGIFTTWDAVASYNRWALSWAANSFPVQTWHYPQMVPILYSLPYVFMGNNEVQFFSFAIFLFFLPLSIAVCLALQAYREYFFAALVLAAGNLAWFLEKNVINLGYADFPVLYFALLSLVTLLLWSRSGAAYGNSLLPLSMLFAAGAAVTKQAGIFWLLLLPFAVGENAAHRPTRRQMWRLGGFFFLLMAFAFSWYIYTEVLIFQGLLGSEVPHVTGSIHEGRSLFERWLRSVDLWPAVWCLWLVALGGLAVRGMRVIALMGLAYTLCWSLFFSYSLRNLSIAIPFLCWSAGIGSWKVYACVKLRISRSRALVAKTTRGLLPLCGIGLVISIGGCLLFSSAINHFLLDLQNEKAMQVGNKEINLLIASAMGEKRLPLLTDYQLAKALPGVREKVIVSLSPIGKFVSTFKKPCYVLYAYPPQRGELEELSPTLPMRLVGTAGGASLYLLE